MPVLQNNIASQMPSVCYGMKKIPPVFYTACGAHLQEWTGS